MTNNNILKNNSILTNVGKTTNKIKLNMYGGVLDGNIIDNPKYPPVPPIISCEPNALDFSCAENSEYIGAV